MTDTRYTRDLFCWYSSTCIPALPAPKPTPKATPSTESTQILFFFTTIATPHSAPLGQKIAIIIRIL